VINDPKGKLADVLNEARNQIPILDWHAICAGIRAFVNGYELRLQPAQDQKVCVRLPWRYTWRKFHNVQAAVAWVIQQMSAEHHMKGKQRRQAEVSETQKWWADKMEGTP
jgi:hypothetical protein